MTTPAYMTRSLSEPGLRLARPPAATGRPISAAGGQLGRRLPVVTLPTAAEQMRQLGNATDRALARGDVRGAIAASNKLLELKRRTAPVRTIG